MRVKPGTPAATGPARQPLEQIVQNATNTSGANGTYQSFILPDMPNITELISGERHDGTPLFNRSVKSRSRFITPSQARRTLNQRVSHAPVGNVPIPADVKALYVSLQLLQEKVERLEAEKAKAEQKIEENELEFLQLKSEVEEQDHARDHGSGIEADAVEEKPRDVEGEKSKLESSFRMLQERLDRAHRKIAKSEAQVASLTKDRDALHKSLGVAYLEAKDQEDTQALDGEVHQLQTELKRVTRDHHKQISRLTTQEAELRGKIERREKAINQMASLAKELFNTRNALADSEETGLAAQAPPSRILQMSKNGRRSQNQEPAGKPVKATSTRNVPSSQWSTKRQSLPATTNQSAVEDEVEDKASDAESTTHIHFDRGTKSRVQLTVDSDFLSFMDGDEVAKLQHVLAEDKAKLGGNAGDNLEDLTGQDVTGRSKSLPRKSSMKRVSYGDLTQQSLRSQQSEKTPDFTERQSTQMSANTANSERRRRTAAQGTEQTSAFILPDIILREGHATNNTHVSGASAVPKQKSRISRPTPVSDRAPDSMDATIRPAQDPAVALATVLGTLGDEIAHLRAQFTEQETLYHTHDPALSKRKRKIVHAQMQKLLAAIESRSDQVYALYDVLEGQKATGTTMKDAEVEVTLMDLGINVEILGGVAGTKSARVELVEGESEADLESESEGELPAWEGFTTKSLDLPVRISA